MTKTEQYKVMSETLENIIGNDKNMTKKSHEALRAMLETYVKPKSGGGTTQHPSKLDEQGNIVEAYCRYTQKYYPVEEMVISNGKSKGYSKKAIALWNKTQRTITKLSSEFVEQEDLTSKSALQIKDRITALKKIANDPQAFQDGSLAKLVG